MTFEAGSSGFEVSKDEKRVLNYVMSTLVAAAIYLVGVVSYEYVNNQISYPDEYVNLHKKKSELVRKVDEWKRFIPLMEEQTALHYKDSLENAVRDTSEISLKMAKMRTQINYVDEIVDENAKYSWFAFLMDK